MSRRTVCEVCGKPACVHLTEVEENRERERMYCLEHAPPEIREKLREAKPRASLPKGPEESE